MGDDFTYDAGRNLYRPQKLVGDGKTDNRAALQRVLDAAGKTRGSVVLAEGVFRLRRNPKPLRLHDDIHGLPLLYYGVMVPSGVALIGTGKTTLRFDEPLYIAGYQAPILVAPGASRVGFAQLTLDGAQRGPGRESGDQGIVAGAVDGLTIRNCRFEGWRGKAVFAYGHTTDPARAARQVLVENCRFARGLGQAVSAVGVRGLTIRDCIVTENLNFAAGGGAEAVIIADGEDLTLERIIVRNWGSGLALNSVRGHRRVRIADCQFFGMGIAVHPNARIEDLTLEKNLFDYAGAPRGANVQAVWLGSPDGAMVRNNTFRGGGARTALLWVAGRRVTISGNTFERGAATDRAGVLVGGPGAGEIQVTQNRGDAGLALRAGVVVATGNQCETLELRSLVGARVRDNQVRMTRETATAVRVVDCQRLDFAHNEITSPGRDPAVHITGGQDILLSGNVLHLTGAGALAIRSDRAGGVVAESNRFEKTSGKVRLHGAMQSRGNLGL